jgi:hypothetical protein
VQQAPIQPIIRQTEDDVDVEDEDTRQSLTTFIKRDFAEEGGFSRE